MLIVIINFNGLEDTLQCLDSLRSQTFRDVVVQVIDNGSTADDLSQITTGFPEVEVVSLPDNRGWAGGNNVGMQQALDRGFDFVCLLNNDTVLDPTAIEELLIAAVALGRPCLMHPTIAYYDAPARWQLNPQSATTYDGFQPATNIIEMDWAYGACLLMPVSVLKSVGMLDERFFLQLEETDYFRRAQARGIGSFCAMRSRILHKESASFGGPITGTKTYYQVRNSFLLAEKHEPNVRGFLRAARAVLWSLRNQAGSVDARIKGWPGFARWLLSDNSIACAAREGATDYICRRFGRRSAGKPIS